MYKLGLSLAQFKFGQLNQPKPAMLFYYCSYFLVNYSSQPVVSVCLCMRVFMQTFSEEETFYVTFINAYFSKATQLSADN